MKKVLLLFLILGFFASVIPSDVFASEKYFAGETEIKCSDSFLGTTRPVKMGKGERAHYYPAYYLQLALNIMKYVGVILCITLTVVDFFKELLSEDKDGYKKVINRAIKRLVFAVIIFILPILVMQLLQLVGVVSNATCGIQ